MKEAMQSFTFANQMTSGQQQDAPALPGVTGVKLKQTTLKDAIVVGGARRIWRLTATANVGRIKKKIKAVWDMKHISMQRKRHNMGPGGFLYWREE